MDKIFPSDGNDVSSILTLNTNFILFTYFYFFDKITLCRYSIMAIQVLGKDQQQVQFLLSAPLINLFELFGV